MISVRLMDHLCDKCQLGVLLIWKLSVVCLIYVVNVSYVPDICDKCQLCISFM